MAFDNLFWWGRIPRSEGGLSSFTAARPRLSEPTHLTPLQFLGRPEILRSADEVGATGGLPEVGREYRANPGSSPAAPAASGPRTPAIGAPTAGAPRAGGGISPGIRTAIAIGAPIAARVVGGIPGLVISTVASVLNRVIGPARTAAPAVPGAVNSGSLAATAAAAGAFSPDYVTDPNVYVDAMYAAGYDQGAVSVGGANPNLADNEANYSDLAFPVEVGEPGEPTGEWAGVGEFPINSERESFTPESIA